MVISDDDDDGSVLVQLQESLSEADSVSGYMSRCTLLLDTVAKPWGGWVQISPLSSKATPVICTESMRKISLWLGGRGTSSSPMLANKTH